MEDFTFTRTAEKTDRSAFQNEWLESQINIVTAASTGKSELALANTTQNENQEPGKEKLSTSDKANSDKDRSESLDNELRDFANTKFENPSHNMQNFQKAIGKFCDAADKSSALDDLGNTYSTISKLMDVGVEALYNESKLEAARQPGRKELEADYKNKQKAYTDKLIDLPFDEYWRIHNLTEWKAGETKAEHRERVRAGLANNKKMLDAFNAREAAEDAIEAHKSPREKQLESLSKQIYSDAKIMKTQLEKAYIRSTF